MLEIRNTVRKMSNTLWVIINGRLDTAEEIISELENISKRILEDQDGNVRGCP